MNRRVHFASKCVKMGVMCEFQNGIKPYSLGRATILFEIYTLI